LGGTAGACSEGEEGEVAYCELVWFVEEDGVVGLYVVLEDWIMVREGDLRAWLRWGGVVIVGDMLAFGVVNVEWDGYYAAYELDP
jgi:hypothetical protein